MTERSLIDAAARLRRQGEPYLVATAVRSGARMVLTRFRWIAGGITGGCLEGDVANRAWCETRGGAPQVVRLDGSIDDPDLRAAFGLCDGAVDVLVERAGADGRIDALEVAERCLRAGRRGAIATVVRAGAANVRVGTRLAIVEGRALEHDPDPIDAELGARIAGELRAVIERGAPAAAIITCAGGAIEVLIEAVRPPPRLFLLGAGHDAVPVAQLARGLGWDVVVCAGEPRHATRERFSGAAVIAPDELAARVAESDRAVAVVMHHDDARDRASLGELLATRIGYIGVLGPRDRARRLLRELGADDEDPRVHAPVGLDLGAETAAERALAILGELQLVVARAPDAQPVPVCERLAAA